MKYIGALDQGTTSTRFILFSEDGVPTHSHQIEHKQYYPRPGWVEHEAKDIWENSKKCIKKTLEDNGILASDVLGIGITNQRETIVAFDKVTGKIYHHAIVWQDLRGADLIDKLKETVDPKWFHKKSGLILSPYFSASKIAWMLDNIKGLRKKAENGDLVFGTIDTFLVWNLTKEHRVVTDVTNASRYALMDIEKIEWDDELLKLFNIPKQCLPEIVPSYGEIYGYTPKDSVFKEEIPVCGILGDQQAALFGQACFEVGSAKCTYGTGCFLLSNTGTKRYESSNGLLTTVAYMGSDRKPVYALEGSIAVAGSLVQWVRDNLKLIEDAQELDQLASSVPDNGGVYIVPAFAGLFAPYWRSDARGVIAGLTGFANRKHICRAVLESTAFQANDLFEAMEADSKVKLKYLKVDGGLTNSIPLMEFQADILGIPVSRPYVVETTARGASYAAGLSVGLYKDTSELEKYWRQKLRWDPIMSEEERKKRISFWRKAVERTLDWET